VKVWGGHSCLLPLKLFLVATIGSSAADSNLFLYSSGLKSKAADKTVAQFEFAFSRWGHPELAKDLARGGYSPLQYLWQCARDPSGLKSLRMTPERYIRPN
jgi:hypothetical protein